MQRATIPPRGKRRGQRQEKRTPETMIRMRPELVRMSERLQGLKKIKGMGGSEALDKAILCVAQLLDDLDDVGAEIELLCD